MRMVQDSHGVNTWLKVSLWYETHVNLAWPSNTALSQRSQTSWMFLIHIQCKIIPHSYEGLKITQWHHHFKRSSTVKAKVHKLFSLKCESLYDWATEWRPIKRGDITNSQSEISEFSTVLIKTLTVGRSHVRKLPVTPVELNGHCCSRGLGWFKISQRHF